MKIVRLVRHGDNATVIDRLWVARSIMERTQGLLARPQLQDGEGLMLAPCSSVHTVGMRYPIDVAFLDRHGVVRKCVPNLKVFRMAGCFGAETTLEVLGGGLQRASIKVGDKLIMVD